MFSSQKKFRFLLSQFLIIVGVFLFVNNARAEEVKSYDIKVDVNKDSTLNVVERIEYDFGIAQKHGIYRSIPIKDSNYDIDLSRIEITDENGEPYSFDKKYNFNYDSYFLSWFDLKIGDEDKLVSGVKTYVIKYKVAKAIGYLENNDRLYWNLIGNKWEVSLNNISASITLPERIDNSLSFECFTGELGSKSECVGSLTADNDKTRIDINKISVLQPGESLTVLINLPKGIVLVPTRFQNVLYFIKMNPLLFLPLVVFMILFFVWKKYGRDPKGRGTIIPQYDAPDDLRPIEIGVILDEECNNRDIVGEIIYLATKGYLKIISLDDDDYSFERLKDCKDLTNEYDRAIFNILFEGSSKSIKLSELSSKAEDFISLRGKVYSSLIKNKIFNNNPEYIRNFYFVFAGFFLVITFIIVFGVQAYIPWLNVLGLLVSAIICCIFAFFMPQKSERGALLKEYILGLKMYLDVAEKDRINFHNAPEKKPEHFEKLLPYAIVLGVEKEWAKQFEGICDKPFNWYEAGPVGSFSIINFSSSLSSFSSSFSGSTFSAGSSNFGGGGFSGGGAGGGGGGSW